MTQDAVGTNRIPDVIQTLTMESGDVQQLNGLVTVTLTPDERTNAAKEIRTPVTAGTVTSLTMDGNDFVAHVLNNCGRMGGLSPIYA